MNNFAVNLHNIPTKFKLIYLLGVILSFAMEPKFSLFNKLPFGLHLGN